MNILLLKLILAPLIIGSASFAGRKWGSTVSGWLIGLPLTSGPVIFFLSFSHENDFMLSSILGTLSGGFALVAFCLTYAWLATCFRWFIAMTGSLLIFALVTMLMQNILILLMPVFALVVLAILLGMWLMPKHIEVVTAEAKPGSWDIPARILIGTGFILLLTEFASVIGPRLTGLLSTIPLYTLILTVFAHRLQGPIGAIRVLRGLLFGMFSFVSFFFTLGIVIGSLSVGASFIVAIMITLLIQGITLMILQRKDKIRGI